MYQIITNDLLLDIIFSYSDEKSSSSLLQVCRDTYKPDLVYNMTLNSTINIEELSKYKNLRSLKFNRGEINNCNKLNILNKLESLELCGLDTDNFYFANVGSLITLRKLNLGKSIISGSYFEMFSGLTNLRELHCSINNMPSEVINKLKHLKILYLDQNYMLDDNALNGLNIEELYCGNNDKITDIGINYIKHSLKVLHMNSNKLITKNALIGSKIEDIQLQCNMINMELISELKCLKTIRFKNDYFLSGCQNANIFHWLNLCYQVIIE